MIHGMFLRFFQSPCYFALLSSALLLTSTLLYLQYPLQSHFLFNPIYIETIGPLKEPLKQSLKEPCRASPKTSRGAPGSPAPRLRCGSSGAVSRSGGGLGFRVQDLAFFWLALRTLTFWVSIINYNKEAKSLTVRRGSEVSQEDITLNPKLLQLSIQAVRVQEVREQWFRALSVKGFRAYRESGL